MQKWLINVKEEPGAKIATLDTRKSLILPVRRGVGMTPQRFFDNSGQNEPKLAKCLLIQVR